MPEPILPMSHRLMFAFFSPCRRRLGGLLLGLAVLSLAACAVPAGAPAQSSERHSIATLHLLGEQRIAHNFHFMETTVGGLSGIDYDAASNTWVSESDDRSEVNPARFYRLRLDYDLAGFHGLELTDMRYFRQADGSTYPGQAEFSQRGGEVPDLESIRVDPQDGSLWYSSEGGRRLGLPPFVKHARADGSYLATFPVGALFDLAPKPGYAVAGPRDNLSFEGLSFSVDGKSLWLAMEAPLFQDGAVASVQDGAFSRMTQYDRNGHQRAQYAYPIDAIPLAYPGRYADNGVSEVLAVDAQHLLVIERSGVQDLQNVFHFHIRLYEMDVGQASDISARVSLQTADFTPASKRLILDFDESGLERVDNLEGIAWGPKLANGHDSLVLVSDNNFNASQVTQLLVFEVLPK